MEFLATFLSAVVASTIVVILRGLILSYPAMLLFGAIHSWYPQIPAFGYAQTLAIVILLVLLIPTGTAKSD